MAVRELRQKSGRAVGSRVVIKIFLCSMGMLFLCESVFAAPCKISQSVYRDTDGKGFELVFGAPPPGSPFLASVTLHHTQQKLLYRFNLTQANGYGSISLLWRQSPDQKGQSFPLNFFSQDFKAATPVIFGREEQAPTYAFITGLGRFDYYQRRGQISGHTPPQMVDMMWVHSRCLSRN